MAYRGLFSILFIFVALCMGTCQANIFEVPDDLCVDKAFQRWHLRMVSAFSQYAEFISYMSQSRTLFQALFTQDFTSDSFKTYCKGHEDARKTYEGCSESDARNMADIEFALADHVCIRAVTKFSNFLPCLQNFNVDAFTQCRNSCRNYEKDSQRYINPSADDLNNERMNWIPYMANDCHYLKCMTDCRKPIFAQKCGQDASLLEYEALKITFAKKIDYYDPPMLRNWMRDSALLANLIFPVECQQLADDALNS